MFRIFLCILAFGMVVGAFPAGSRASETKTVLGSVPIPINIGTEPVRFAAMLEHMRVAKSGPCLLTHACAGDTANWLSGLKDKLGTGPDNTLEKLIAVQGYFSVGRLKPNRRSPIWTYQYEALGLDEWKDAAVFLKDKGGDCEDFAIVKAAALHALGVIGLKIVILRDKDAHEHHAVLAVETRNATYILDNKLGTVVHDDSLFVKSYKPLFYVDYDPEADLQNLNVGLFGLGTGNANSAPLLP